MADRKAVKPGKPEEPQEIVELDKDERWQARLEEARARRELALREKASNPKKKQRRKPWEEEPGDDPDDFEIKPIIQKKPADEKTLDLADRLEAARKGKETGGKPGSKPKAPVAAKPAPVPEIAPPPEAEAEIEPDPAPAPPPPKPKPKLKRKSKPKAKPVPEFKSKSRSFDDIIPPVSVPTVAPAPMPKRKSRRGGELVVEGAPDVIDLAKRYGSTLKPPVNVTQPFDTVPREVTTTPPPEPIVLTKRQYRSRRPFGLGMAVMAFSLIPLAQVAPPLEKGPPQPPSPFFALPPALGLTTSMVWPIEQTAAGEWLPGNAPTVLAAPPIVDNSPVAGAGSPSLPGSLSPEAAFETTVSPLSPLPDTFILPQALSEAPVPDAPGEPLVVPTPKPRPVAPELESEASPEIEDAPGVTGGTVVDRSIGRSGPDLLEITAPDARPRPTPDAIEPPTSPLRVTILVPSAADLSEAENIASDARARGHELARVQEVNLSISAPNVRYFHPEDRAEAARLAEAYGAEIKDFTWFRPTPEKGTTEIWLSGSGTSRPSPPAASSRTVEDAPQTPPRTITLIRKQPTFLERLLTGAQDEIEIVLPDPAAILENAEAGSTGGN